MKVHWSFALPFTVLSFENVILLFFGPWSGVFNGNVKPLEQLRIRSCN